MERSTFAYRLNRHGVPYEAVAYFCEHGQNMSVCERGDAYHRQTGDAMIAWWNSQPVQFREREVDRSRIINGEIITTDDLEKA